MNRKGRNKTSFLYFPAFLFAALWSKGNHIKSQEREATTQSGDLLRTYIFLTSLFPLFFFFFLIALYTCEPVSINILSVADEPLKEDLRDFQQNVSKEKSPHSDQNYQVPPLRGEFAFKN